MQRRRFLKGLCKAVGVAAVVPLAFIPDTPGVGGKIISLPFDDKWIISHDPICQPMIQQKFKWGDNETTVTWMWNEQFDGKFDHTMFRHLGDDVWERVKYPKPKINIESYKMHWIDMSEYGT